MRGSKQWMTVASVIALVSMLEARDAVAGNDTVPGAITSYATVVCAGFEWRISGDDNSNCAVAVDYRKQGAQSWSAAQPLWRVETGLWHHGEDPGDLLAGSLFFLDPGTTYEARLTLNDPDGGSAQQIVTVTTRTEPQPTPNGRTRFVAPGNGGGTGSQTQPFLGLAAADAAAQPGDIFTVEPGSYTTKFVPVHDGAVANPIVYRGASPATVILDGLGGADGTANCVDLTNRRYLFIENMSLVNCLRPVVVTNTVGVVIRACTIQPIRQLVSTRGIVGDGVQDLFVSDNTFLMPGDWAGIGRTGAYGTGGYGVVVTGHGIILCYNRVVESWDGLDAGGSDGTGPRTFNVDIYNNLVDRASDDATQTDAVHQNIRVFRNRFVNSGSAVSAQPSFGGPCYFLFNEMFNTRIDPFKYHQETSYFGTADPQETSGMIAYHNTNVCSKSAWYESGYWHHARHRNNLLLGERPATYSLYSPSAQRGDLDYDGYNRQQSTLVKYNNIGYATLAAFYAGAGEEPHGLEVTLAEFVNAPALPHPEWDWPQGYGTAIAPSDVDVELTATSVAIDRGEVLPNINDGYVGGAPDLGCYERGKPTPAYGPRPGLGLVDVARAAAEVLSLVALGPNPAPGRVAFALEMPERMEVTLRIFDVTGRVIRTLEEAREFSGGTHAVGWDGCDASGIRVPNGIYFLDARCGSVSLTRKIALMR